MEQAKEIVKDVLSELQNRHQENTQDSEKQSIRIDIDEAHAEAILSNSIRQEHIIRIQQQRLDVWIKALGGLRAYQDFKLSSFQPLHNIPKGFPTTTNIYIHGPIGSGKTHLATAIARSIQHPARLKTRKPMEIFREMRSCKSAPEESELINDYADILVLMIDDLGVSKETEFSSQVLYEIIDRRYMAMRGGLIITSNLSLDEFCEKTGDDRIASRLAQMCNIITLTGKDHRLK